MPSQSVLQQYVSALQTAATQGSHVGSSGVLFWPALHGSFAQSHPAAQEGVFTACVTHAAVQCAAQHDGIAAHTSWMHLSTGQRSCAFVVHSADHAGGSGLQQLSVVASIVAHTSSMHGSKQLAVFNGAALSLPLQTECAHVGAGGQ